MTLHCHIVNGHLGDGDLYIDHNQPMHVPSGWQIAEGNANDLHVCGAHPWCTYHLVFGNGMYSGTADCYSKSDIGASAHKSIKFCLTHENTVTGKAVQTECNQYHQLVRNEQGVSDNWGWELLLWRRA